MSHFFALIARLRYIRRWGLMRSSVPENVAEHSLMVAVLAHGLAVIRRDALGLDADPDAAAAAALYHDASEILTGDMPTPVKYQNREIRAAYRTVEQKAVTRLLALLPEELRPAYAKIMSEQSEPIRRIVHAADKLAAYIKCVEELQAGNREFTQAARQLHDKLCALDCPELSYFMEHFLPSFSLSLDDQQQ